MFADGKKFAGRLLFTLALARLPSSTRVASSHPAPNPVHSHLHINLHATIHQNALGDIPTSICLPPFTRTHRVASAWPRPGPDRHRAAPASPPGGSQAGTSARGAARARRGQPFLRNLNVCGRPEELFYLLKILRIAEILFIHPQNLLELFGNVPQSKGVATMPHPTPTHPPLLAKQNGWQT
jgi:hypothetical protein